MSQALPKPRDWFDDFWDANVRSLPAIMRGTSVKELARNLMQEALKGMAKQAGTPDGVRAIIAFARITAICEGAKGVLDAPHPTPEQVTEAVQRLVDRVKP